jgi:HEAT repeat protein
MQVQTVPEWKYQRQFQHGDGMQTAGKRLPIFSDAAPKLLSDAQIRSFLANGFLTLRTDLPAEYHEEMFRRFEEIIGDDNDDNPGNNLLPLLPELNRVFDDPVVRGALTSVLGPDYLMHPHRVLHDNPPGSDAQVWHHDSYWGYKRKVHNHRPWWVMIMYYPQDIYERIGPTGVIPGSHCIAQRLEDIDQIGTAAEGPGGTVMMIHYDIWHRKMKNLTNLKRFMVKFEFTRMTRPQGATWDNRDAGWKMPDDPPAHIIEPLWRDQWNWLSGRPLPREAADPVAIPALAARLDDVSEPAGLNAAYTLGAIGAAAVPALVAAMRGNDGENVDDARVFIDEGQHSEVEMACRNAAHGLVSLGRDAVPALLGGLCDGGPRVRKYAVFALGEIDSEAPAVLSAIAKACRDPDAYVRINAVEAAGLKRGGTEIVEALVSALDDGDDEVRFTAALSLARLGPAAASAVPALAEALNDGNRYVAGYAVEALDRIGTPEAVAVLVPFLKVARWCPITNNRNLF